MKLNKFKILILSLLVIISIIFLGGCKIDLISQEYVYDDTNYSVGNKAFIEPINEINIDWLLGNIFIIPSENHELIIKEDVRGNDTEKVEDIYRMHYYFDEGNLNIKFAGSNKNLNYYYKTKVLYIFLPKEINEIDINCVSANVNIENVHIRDLNIENVSGDIQIFKLNSEDFSIENVSGDISLNVSKINKLLIESVSGEIIIFDDELMQVYIESVSGNIGLTFSTKPLILDVETVSANITMYVNSNDSLNIEFESSSGSFHTKLSYEVLGSSYVFNGGSTNIYNFDTLSGNLKINKK